MPGEPPESDSGEDVELDTAHGARSPRPGQTRRRPISPLLFLGAGIEFTAVTAALALLGWWLDGQIGARPWLMVIGLAVGLIGGTYKLWKTGKRFFK